MTPDFLEMAKNLAQRLEWFGSRKVTDADIADIVLSLRNVYAMGKESK